MNVRQLIIWTGRFILLLVLFYILFMAGTMALSGALPESPSEPGLLPAGTGLLLIGIANTLLVMGLVLSSRWSGWKLIVALVFGYYGTVTFMMQIETWYFLSGITVSPDLLLRLFLMGLPVAFFYIPLAVWICGKGRPSEAVSYRTDIVAMPAAQWLWKLGAIALAYVVLYWSAGYFIAWQNPELRAFYGSPGEIVPFWEHTSLTLRTDPALFPFQVLRSLLWVLFALPVIWGSRLNPWWTALLVGLLFTLPQNLGHVLENPLMPLASVRLSHLVETASSTFVFGLLVSWLLHRRHASLRDALGMK